MRKCSAREEVSSIDQVCSTDHELPPLEVDKGIVDAQVECVKRGSERWTGNVESKNLTKVAPLASQPEDYEEEAERIIRRSLHHRKPCGQYTPP